MAILEPEERLGRTIGSYRLDSVLGEGGMGVVFAGTHVELGTPVAIKLLHPHLVRDAEVARRFEREARAAARLRHDHVVRILDLLTAEDGARCIVMDRLEGESLHELLEREGSLGVERTTRLLVPIMDALVSAHEAGIVHRDLKPDNIFVARRSGGEKPVLLDFGVAKLLDGSRATQTGWMLGTPQYMSPEQARGEGDVGPAADIWAMGAVWFECLGGRPPVEGNTPQAVIANLLTAPVPSLGQLASVPPEVVALVDGALQRDPAARYPDMRAFATRARALASGTPVALPQATPQPAPKVVTPLATQPTALAMTPHRAAEDAVELPGRGGGRTMALVAVVGLLLVGGIATAAVMLGGGDAPPVTAAAIPEPPRASEPVAEAPEPAEAAPAPPAAPTEALPEGRATPADPEPASAMAAMTAASSDEPRPRRSRPSRMGRDIDSLLREAVGSMTAARPSPMSDADLPEQPSRADIANAMSRVRGRVAACSDGWTGTARVRMVFGQDGRVQSATVGADDATDSFRGCIARAVRAARLPPFRGNILQVTYPFRFQAAAATADPPANPF